MRNTALFTTAAFSALLATSAQAETRDYDLKPFDKVLVTSGMSVHVTKGDTQSVRVETNKLDQLDHLILEVRNGALYAEFDKSLLDRVLDGGILADWFSGEVAVDIHVTVPELSKLNVSAGAYGEATGFGGKEFSAKASSGSRLSLTGFDFADISLGASSGANIEVDGA